MKYLILFCLISTGALASGKNLKMKVTPLNSPVMEANIIFKLEPPKGMAFNDVNARIKNKAKPPFRDRIKDYPVEKSGTQILLKLPTRDYPVDKYEILVYTKNDNRKIWEFWKKAPPLAFGSAKFEVKTQQIVIDGDPQPPHPGEAGKETLLGIDSDNDGVRDDVEIWINEAYAGKRYTIKALKMMARAQQKVFLAATKEQSIQATLEKVTAYTCALWASGDEMNLDQKIELISVNTKARVIAALKERENFTGQMTPENLLGGSLEQIVKRNCGEDFQKDI